MIVLLHIAVLTLIGFMLYGVATCVHLIIEGIDE
jgi:hypothetical protein